MEQEVNKTEVQNETPAKDIELLTDEEVWEFVAKLQRWHVEAQRSYNCIFHLVRRGTCVFVFIAIDVIQ